MPRYGDDDLVRIDLPGEGEWVEVKRHLSRGDHVAIQRAVFGGTPIRATGDAPGIGDADFGAMLEAAEFATLDVAIKRWSWPDDVTPARIRELDEESVAAIKERLSELYEPRTDDERKNSSGNGATSPSARVPHHATSSVSP